MRYEEIPHIEILDKECATAEEIIAFLNVGSSAFYNMKILPVRNRKKGVKALYSISDLKKKIDNRIEIFLESEYIKDFPNYIIDKKGNVYLVKGKVVPYRLKHKIDRYGYDTVTLMNENGRGYFTIHRLIAITYIPNPFNLPQVNHINGDKMDNSIENLEWCTTQYNIQHAFDSDLNKTGVEHTKSVPVIAYKNNGDIDGIFETELSCSDYYGISDATIRSSDRHRTTKGHHGYYFRRITKEKFYDLKENKLYEQYFIEYEHAKKCDENLKYTA